MFIIDTHTHAGLNWFQPVESLLNEMNLCGVAGAVLIQYGGSYDNSYQFECARRFPNRFKVAVQIDPDDPTPESTLVSLKESGAAGIRLYASSEFKTRDPFAIWKLAGELGLTVSTGGSGGPEQYGAKFKKLLDACPRTHFQIEHLAGVGASAEAPYSTYKEALRCSQWPHTSIKIPGIGEIMKRPARLPAGYPFSQPPALFELALEAFGPKRMVWASDFPLCTTREGYRSCIEGVRSYPAFKNGDSLDWILGKSAARIWGFDIIDQPPEASARS